MRLGLLSDIHGNSIALRAVLADLVPLQLDAYLVLGDIVDGFDPSGVPELLKALPNVSCVYGNTDAYVITGNGFPPFTVEGVKADPNRAAKFQECTASFAWTKGWLCATGWFDWLQDLPLEYRLTLPGGARLLAVHASPGMADGPGIKIQTPDSELSRLLAGCSEAVICVGHTHAPFIRHLDGHTVLNPGSVGNPLAPDLRACYAVIDATESGLDIAHHRVDYDKAAVLEAVRRVRHPAADFIIAHQVGRMTVADMLKASEARSDMLPRDRR